MAECLTVSCVRSWNGKTHRHTHAHTHARTHTHTTHTHTSSCPITKKCPLFSRFGKTAKSDY